MIDKNKIVVLMTALNEAKVISNVLNGLINSGYKNIVLVDDGSTDETYNIAKRYDIFLLRHVVNRGKGASLQTGTEFILKNTNFEVIVHFDADGQHNPEDIENLVRPILEEGFDVVFGSRFLGEVENMPYIRKIVLKFGILISNFLYGVKLTDVHNGLRAFKREVFKKIVFTEDRFSYASELLEKVVKNGFKYKEVPVKIVYTEYSISKGQKNINAFNIFFHMIKRRFFA
ncbi:MAG: glycosyltransferase family 2 protein [Proteobacteria bacterium]|nr:glycosyltransferase family 2 protein [Pseudomonadota bacterium]